MGRRSSRSSAHLCKFEHAMPTCECGCQHLCPQEALETARREGLTLAIKRNAPTDGRNAYLGVFPVKSQVHGWLARFGTGGSLRNLGTFRWPEEAALAIARAKRDQPVAHAESTESEASSHAPPGRKRKSGAENRSCKKPAASHEFSEESVRHSSGALAGGDADTEQRGGEQTKFCAVPVRERVNGEWYDTKNGRRRWLASKHDFSCEHGKRKELCSTCDGRWLCPHGRPRGTCTASEECAAAAAGRTKRASGGARLKLKNSKDAGQLVSAGSNDFAVVFNHGRLWYRHLTSPREHWQAHDVAASSALVCMAADPASNPAI
eukprot:7334787-Prymnesium_polylepis.1